MVVFNYSVPSTKGEKQICNHFIRCNLYNRSAVSCMDTNASLLILIQ
jgi:hypothetical protein